MQQCTESVGLLFETSWEVCNKIGGIYTVLSTKAKTLQDIYKDKVIFIGPDVWTQENPSPYFKEYKTLLKNCVKSVALPYGMTIRVGRWLIPGSPIVVLVKFDGIYEHINDFYSKMWECYGVDSLHSYGDYSEGCAFGLASAMVMSALTDHLKVNQADVIAHFNEWTTGMGLLYMKMLKPEAATLFTTHATSIGRSICGNGKPLYDYLSGYNGDQMAAELNMQSKHSLEKAAAHSADCFTTVSDVTAVECCQLLDIEPQVVTPNGFEPNFVPVGKRYAELRKNGRKALLNIASKLTGKTFTDDTFIVATSGRNEYRNKGIDMFIDSINRLSCNFDSLSKEILAFILVPAWVKEPAFGLAENIASDKSNKLEVNFMTHRLNNEDSDSVACHLRSLNINSDNSKVTIVYLPCYLDGRDGILNVTYYDIMPALDATVFASYYEPWGYTPLESVAFGVPTISTDKAGFGRWIISNFENQFVGSGVNVISRTDSNYHEAVNQVAESLLHLSAMSNEEIQKVRKAAQTTAAQADWAEFIAYYIKAFTVARKRRNERCQNLFFN